MLQMKEKNRVINIILIGLCFLTFGSPNALAWETSGEVGAGLLYTEVYTGSDEFYLTPLPIFKIALEGERNSIYLSIIDGVGVRHIFGTNGYFTDISLNFGSERDSQHYTVMGFERSHSDRTKSFLKNTPTVSTDVIGKMAFGYSAQWGTIICSAEYHPTKVDYSDSLTEDENLEGFLYTLAYSRGYALTPEIMVNGVVGVEFMNGAYADAWFSNKNSTEKLKQFDAKGGLKGVLAVFDAVGQLSDDVVVKVTLVAKYLTGDAADSPYTRQKFQPTAIIGAVYNF